MEKRVNMWQSQDSIWIIGTGHQGMTWFVPGTRVGIPPEGEQTGKQALEAESSRPHLQNQRGGPCARQRRETLPGTLSNIQCPQTLRGRQKAVASGRQAFNSVCCTKEI